MLNEAKHTSEERLVVALGDQNDTKILSVPAYQPGTDQRSGDRIFRHNEWSFTPNSGRTFASSLECIFPAAWYLNELLPIYQYWRDDQPEEVDCIDSFLALLASCDNLHVGLSAFTTFHSTNSFLTAHQVLLSIQHLGYVKILKYVLCSCIYSVVHCVGSVVFVPFCMPSSSDGWNWYWESDSQNLNHSVIISVSVYSVVLLFNPVSKTYFRNGRHLFSNAWWILSHLLHLHHQAHHHSSSSNLYLKCESSSDSDCDATTVGGLQPYMYEPAADSSAPCTTPTAVGFTSNILCPTKNLSYKETMSTMRTRCEFVTHGICVRVHITGRQMRPELLSVDSSSGKTTHTRMLAVLCTIHAENHVVCWMNVSVPVKTIIIEHVVLIHIASQ